MMNVTEGAHGTPRKQGRRSATPGPGTPIAWSDVLRAVESDETRQRIVERYRSAGFTLDQFATVRRAREAMSDAITRAEDWLELEKPTAGDRTRLKAVRRRLEWELWP